MKITDEGFAILEGDTHLSKWIEETGKIDHNQNLYLRFREMNVCPGQTVIDVGACLGDTTVPLAEIVGTEGRVFAFEPNPEPFACLCYNTRNYPQVKCLPYALGDRNGTVTLTSQKNIGASFIVENGDVIAPMVRLDQLDIQGVRFIKIDVEGYELNVLKGALQTIEHRPKLYVETAVHSKRYRIERRAVYSFLEDLGYSITPHYLEMEDAPQYDFLATPNVLPLTKEAKTDTT